MKLGLITDIHEHVDYLSLALNRLREVNVEQIVLIGDVCEMGRRLEPTCRLLADADVVGVWGNHDYGLCFEPDDYVRAKYPPAVLDYMATLRPRLEIEGCRFAHVEPWLNPEVVSDLWYFEGPPDEPRKLDRIFQAVPNRIMFAGHYHRWRLAKPSGICDWRGDAPVRLDDDRYFVVIGALCDGRFATFDTVMSELTPFNEG